jgi:5-methylthioadenosine/S-adenosylhomocysteine deaminase
VTAPVTGQERTEPIAVDTVVTGEWIITLNADREVYRDGAIAVSGGVITEVGKRAAILAKYQPATLIDEPDGIVIPGLINGHRHLLCCAKGAMPEGGQTLSALRQFIYPSFAALTEEDMHELSSGAASPSLTASPRLNLSLS